MSYTTAAGFTNVTANTVTIAPIKLLPITNYALVKDEPDHVQLTNKTCPMDKQEIITYRQRTLAKVNSYCDVQYPSKNQAAIQYSARLDTVYTTTSTTDATYRVDDPISVQLTITHTKSGNITSAIALAEVARMLGMVQNSDGTWKFDDLMRASLKPTKD